MFSFVAGKSPVIKKKVSSAQKFLSMGKNEVKTRMQRYQPTVKRDVLHVLVSKPVWQVNGSCKAVVVLDPAKMTKKGQTQNFIIRPDVLQKKFAIDLATANDDIEGDYVQSIQENLNGVYNRRKCTGDDENIPWYSNNGNYNYRILAGVIVFHGINKDDDVGFASELDVFKKSIENIKSDPNFQEDYTFATFCQYCARDLDFEQIQQKLAAAGSLQAMYENEQDAAKIFGHVWKTNAQEVVDFQNKHEVVITQNLSLDEIFLDHDAVQLGSKLYGMFTEKYKDILMKNPANRSRSFIPRNMKKSK